MQNKVKKTLDYFKLNGLGVVKYLAFFCLFYLALLPEFSEGLAWAAERCSYLY